MNAYLMAAGNGMRLRPLTHDVQKCMLPVGGRPMLEWWIDAVFSAGVFDHVFVNLHHMADDVERWLRTYYQKTGREVRIIDERAELLGTAGTLMSHGVRGEAFMVAYTDTFSMKVLKGVARLTRNFLSEPEEIVAGLLSFWHPADGSASRIVIGDGRKVYGFEEKSDEGAEAWAGVMFGRPEFYGTIEMSDRDLARDVFPRLSGRMSVVDRVDAYDIGRGPDHYERFNSEFRSIVELTRS